MLFKTMKEIYLCVIKVIACSELDWLYETGVARVNLEFQGGVPSYRLTWLAIFGTIKWWTFLQKVPKLQTQCRGPVQWLRLAETW